MSAPRFPAVALAKGHYESYYLRAADPAGGRSAWIRHTVFKRPGGPATGALWCTLFEAGKPPRAVKQSLPDPQRRRLADDRRQPLRPARREGPRRGARPQRGLGPQLRPELRAPAPPPPPAPLRRPAPPHQDGEPAARHDDLRPRRGLGARRLARRGRPQLGRRARRALDLAARRRLRRRARRVARRRARPRQGRPVHHAVDRQRRAAPRRRAHPRRRPRPPRPRGRGPGGRPHRGQRPHDRRARRSARLLDLLRPLGRRAPQHELLDRIASTSPSAAARCAREHGGAWELGTREAPIGVEVQPFPDP